MYMLINVSPSISYGIRYYSQSSGSTVPLWAESDALSHREGTGQAENVQVNMSQVIVTNTGQDYDSTSSVTIYVERSASTQATHFSLQIKKLEFLNFPLLSAPASGSYHAIYVGLGQIQENPSFTLRSVEIRGTINASNGMVFVPYFIDGLSIYQGPVYTLATIPIDLSVTVAITPQGAKSFSDNLPTEKAAIVLVAASGTFVRLSVENISLNYYSKTARPEAFLVAIPFLLKGIFEDQKFRKLLATFIVLASVPAFAVYAYAQTGNILAPFQSEATGPKCTILCFFNNPVYQVANGVLPYTINFVTMILAVIFVAIPLIKGNVSSKLFPYYTWAFVLLAVVFYSGEVRSFARFALVVPPVFWAQAEYSAIHPRFYRGLLVVYSVLMCLATILWVNWYPML